MGIGVSTTVSISGIGTQALIRKDRVLWTSDFRMPHIFVMLLWNY
jgi:hypothetical protein